MSKMDNWFRKHDPRRAKPDNSHRLTNLKRMESIIARQNSGEITVEQGAAEADEMFSEADGNLVYYSDSTGLTAPWHPDLMLFPKADFRFPSNTGIFARGPQRGWLFTKPGETPDCDLGVLQHFTTGSKGWINGPTPTEAPKP